MYGLAALWLYGVGCQGQSVIRFTSLITRQTTPQWTLGQQSEGKEAGDRSMLHWEEYRLILCRTEVGLGPVHMSTWLHFSTVELS